MELDRQPNLSAALDAYDKQRRDAVNRIVKANREESETRFFEIIHNLCPHVDHEYDFDDTISKEDIAKISNTYKEVAGFDPQILNNRESYSVKSSK